MSNNNTRESMNNFYKYMRRHFIKIAQNRNSPKLHLFPVSQLTTNTKTVSLTYGKYTEKRRTLIVINLNS